MSATTSAQAPVSALGRESIVRSVLTNPLGLIATILLLLVIAAAVFAPVIAPFAADDLQIFKINAPPGDGYLLGGDGSGRDIFSRLVFGARNTLIGALIISVLANGLRILSVPQEWQTVVTGLIIILAVYADILRRRTL